MGRSRAGSAIVSANPTGALGRQGARLTRGSPLLAWTVFGYFVTEMTWRSVGPPVEKPYG